MTIPFPRIIRVVHDIPGRLRLRLPWLHDDPDAAILVADGLARLEGVIEIRVRSFTGGVLSTYDPNRLGVTALLEATQQLTGVTDVVRPGEPLPPAVAERARQNAREPSRVALAAAAFFRGVSTDIRIASEGRFDLGTLATMSLATVGAGEVAVTGELPLPQWFQLAWWAFRTFTTLEGAALGYGEMNDSST